MCEGEEIGSAEFFGQCSVMLPGLTSARKTPIRACADPSVLGGQYLDRRLADRETLVREVAAWKESRNAAESKVHWRFTPADARIKLRTLDPSIQFGRASRLVSKNATTDVPRVTLTDAHLPREPPCEKTR